MALKQLVPLDLNTNKIINLGDPTSAQDAASKNYVDTRQTRYNVKDYGAVGDGIVDDTTAIANAITAASGKGVTFFPSGTYLVNTQTSSRGLALPSNTTIEGVDKESTVIKQGFAISGIGGNALFVNSDTTSGNTNITFKNVRIEVPVIQGTSPSMTAWGRCIRFRGVSHVRIENCHFLNGMVQGDPLPALSNTSTVHTTGNNNYWWVEGNYFQDGPASFAFGQGTDLFFTNNRAVNSADSMFALNSSAERVVVSNNILDKQGNTFAALGVVEVSNNTAADANGIRDLTITGNTILNSNYSNSHGIHLLRVTDCTITGNTIRNMTASTGILSQGGSKLTISGNKVDTTGSYGISVSNDTTINGPIAITGNTVSSSTNAGIRFGGSTQTLDRITVIGNIVTGSSNYGLQASANVTDGLVLDNVFTGNTAGETQITGTGWTNVLPITRGGTGSTTASGARTNLSVYSIAEVDALVIDGGSA